MKGNGAVQLTIMEGDILVSANNGGGFRDILEVAGLEGNFSLHITRKTYEPVKGGVRVFVGPVTGGNVTLYVAKNGRYYTAALNTGEVSPIFVRETLLRLEDEKIHLVPEGFLA